MIDVYLLENKIWTKQKEFLASTSDSKCNAVLQTKVLNKWKIDLSREK